MPSAVMLAILLGIYGLVIGSLAWALDRLRVLESISVFLSFLIFGVGSGILAAILWPMDSSVYPNIPAVWVGDWVYVHAIEYLGDPYSNQAHHTIPSVLIIPQVYVIVSAALCGVLGAAIQWLYNKRRGHGIKRASRHSMAKER